MIFLGLTPVAKAPGTLWLRPAGAVERSLGCDWRKGNFHALLADFVKDDRENHAMSWAARPVCGRRVGNTYLEHRFSAFSALLAHGRFGEVRTSPSYTAALAQQYLRYRAGLHLLHREVETAVWRMCVHSTH